MEKKYLTTTQAAKLLSVSADTVLKWVRAGKISSYRTPGGHCRIPQEAIEGMLPAGGPQDLAGPPISAAEARRFRYCWEYNSNSGQIADDCRSCLVYQSRARRCYEFRDIPEVFGYLRLHCKTTCDQCEYFRNVKEHGLSVLVVTRSGSLIKQLKHDTEHEDIEIKLVTSGYETSCTIESFRPDYIVVDWSIGTRVAQDLCNHLVQDPRIPLTRLILTSPDKEAAEMCESEILGWLRKPFTVTQLRDFIGTIQDSDPTPQTTE